jgi:hypothetical protein
LAGQKVRYAPGFDAAEITLSGEVVAAIDAIHARITNPGQ